MQRRLWVTLVLVLTGALCACETTGDPRQGGLFGWSESKAKSRAADLQGQASASEAEAARAQQQSEQLHEQQASLGTEVANLRQRLSDQLADNEKLEKQLRDLMQQKQVQADRVQKLQQALAANEQVRRQALAARQAPPDAPAAAQAATAVDTQNRLLQREILFLLEQ